MWYRIDFKCFRYLNFVIMCALNKTSGVGSPSFPQGGDRDHKRSAVVIVDGFMTGNTIADEVRRRGLACINVISSNAIPEILLRSLSPEKFLANHLYDGSVKKIVEKLRDYRVFAVLPGAETAVELSEKLAFELGLPGNDPNTTYLRRNKYAMIEALRKAGMHTAEQCIALDAAEIIGWKNECGVQWPIVVKPVDSAGTDSVTICRFNKQLEEAVGKIIGKVNILGNVNSCVLAQTFLDGTEYVVNTLSWNGIHGTTDIWRYVKSEVAGAGRIYDRDELISPGGELQNTLIDYVNRALDVLGVKYGPAHSEVMMTSEGPALVEVGARVQGSINVEFMRRCIGDDQLNQTLDLYRSRRGLNDRLLCPPKLAEHGMRIEMISEGNVAIRDSASFIEGMKRLPSYFSHHLNYQEHELIRKTVDLANTPGEVLLVHSDREQLMEDYEAFRRLEKDYYVLVR